MSEVKIVRMTSGEQIIAKVRQKMEGGYILEKPAMLIPAAQGQLGIVPWMPYADMDEVEVKESTVDFIVKPMKELAQEYTTMNTGLVVPTAPVTPGNLKLSD